MFISELTNKELTDKIIDSVLFEGLEDTGEAADCIIVLGSTKASQYKVPIAVSAYDTHTCRDNWAYNAEGRKRATDEVRKIIDCVGNRLFPDFEV